VIVRYEPWGAWVKLESMPAVVALDRDGVRALGLDGGATWVGAQGDGAADGTPLTALGARSNPIEVHLAVTARCGAGCEGCYIDARPDGVEPPQDTLVGELDRLGDMGVLTVAFGGGEPTTRGDLDVLARAAYARGMTPVLTTSGLGLTDARARKLAGFAQVNVSYDGPGDAYESVRGFDGAAAAERAIERLARAGVRVGVNIVLTRTSFSRLGETIARARALGASEAQLLRYKPAGRAASLDYLARRLAPEQARALGATLRQLATEHCGDAAQPFHVRIDCALVPFLSADPELAGDAARLARFGVLGCEAAGALAAVTVEGRVAPCSFAPADADSGTWLAWIAAPPEPCASCSLRPVCKGGCKVVAGFVDGHIGPDPECPRVLAHHGRSAELRS
jgi:radical SAM protein with 4Fe4S-binding SPASM domain